MEKYNFTFVLAVLLTFCVVEASTSFAAVESHSIVNVEGLTIAEAEKKYGIESGSEHPVVFEVNATSGPQACGLIFAPGNSKACPTVKIFYQSPRLISNHDGTSTLKVDVVYDVNEVAI
jgi:hypothetical protein